VPPHEHHLRVSPLARRAAEELGVDLSAVAGSGAGGAITRDDVERAAAGGPAEPGDRAAAMRLAIGALMARSKREIPHYYLQTQIDMSRALAWLAEENLRRPIAERLLSSALLLSATARATAATPALNGFWVDEAFRPAEGVHLGVAISLRGGGLVAPALHDADRMTLDELMAGLRDLVARARAGRLRGSEMSDPTITVTNLGDQGVDLVHGVIYPPQVALVGFGAVRERPWAVDGMIGARPIVTATLAADHRASDGHAGGRFLTLIDRELQKPEEL
jgi:pyruvate dehydrogenase E2 component (dihydrolipoamide acetyltransferase)